MASEPDTHPTIRTEELWMETPAAEAEVQPLLSSPEKGPTTDLGPAPHGLGPIQLGPDEASEQYVTARSRWSINNLLDDIPAQHRPILNDIGRGCVMVLTTPLAFVGVALYAVGVIIEGIALVFKGVGSYGGMFLLRRRRRASPPASPRTAEAWV